jgi:hypothetical protein
VRGQIRAHQGGTQVIDRSLTENIHPGLLTVRDAAKCRAEVDPDAIRMRVVIRAGRANRFRYGMDTPRQVRIGTGFKAVRNLGGDARRMLSRVEARDRTHRGSTAYRAVDNRVRGGARATDRSHGRHDHAPSNGCHCFNAA